MTPYLLDVNVLLALCDPMHVHHEAAHRWFAEKGSQAWATCPITENGFVRIASGFLRVPRIQLRPARLCCQDWPPILPKWAIAKDLRRSPLMLSSKSIAIFEQCANQYKFRYINRMGDQYLKPCP